MRHLLDRLHARARRWPPFQRLAIVSRILLALAFLPTGMVKLLGQRFTSLPADHPVGAFFEAMYQTGFYWNFIGLGQLVAGLLLLIPATSTLGAVAFFPIVLNITVVTWSIGFKGTIYITALMLLANVFLLCWDYDRLRAILFAPAGRPGGAALPMLAVERLGFGIGTAAGLLVLAATRGMAPAGWVRYGLAAGLLAAGLVVVGWARLAVAARRRPA